MFKVLRFIEQKGEKVIHSWEGISGKITSKYVISNFKAAIATFSKYK